jgi:hypothetical protein
MSTISAGTTSGTTLVATGDTAGTLVFKTNDTGSGGTTAMTINTSQNVGIGTSSPSSPLNVVSASSSLAIAINGRSSDGLGAMYFYANNGSTQYATITTSATEFRLSSVPAAAVQTFYTNGAERMRIDSSGVLSFNSGYGSVAAAYGCRAWVNFNGTGTVAIRASANVSSITDNGTGDYTINLTTAMPDINYNVIGNASNGTNWTYGPAPFISSPSLAEVAPTTSAVRLVVGSNAGSFLDAKYVCYAIFR